MALLVVTYPVKNNALTSRFIARKTIYLPCRIVVIGDDLAVRTSHRPHTVPTVAGDKINVRFFIVSRKHSKR